MITIRSTQAIIISSNATVILGNPSIADLHMLHAVPAAPCSIAWHSCDACMPETMLYHSSQAVLNAAVWPACGCPLVSSKVTCFANILLRYKVCVRVSS